MITKIKLTYIDNGFYRIGGKAAKQLAGGTLPKHGYMKKVSHDGLQWWLQRTMVNRRPVWSIRQIKGQ